MNTVPDPDYDPSLDPTPEDGVITPRDNLIIRAEQLRDANKRFNFWDEYELRAVEDLILFGIEGDTHVYHPNPVTPFALTDFTFDADGFSDQMLDDCVKYQACIEAAIRWERSGNRILKRAAWVISEEWFMLPIPRLALDGAFQDRYLQNGTCTPHLPMQGNRAGFRSKPVYEMIVVNPSTDPMLPDDYAGVRPIDDRSQPLCHSRWSTHRQNILQVFADRFGPTGGGFYAAVSAAAHDCWDGDNIQSKRFEGWTPPPRGLERSRRLEMEVALDNSNYRG